MTVGASGTTTPDRNASNSRAEGCDPVWAVPLSDFVTLPLYPHMGEGEITAVTSAVLEAVA
jgi:hypothetical protein